MATDSFDGFDVDVLSSQRVNVSDSQGLSRWVIDTALLAGQPSLSVKRTNSTKGAVQTTTLNIAITGSRYPGTQLAADLTFSIRAMDSEGGTITIVHLTLSFGNAAFHWDASGFVDWLTGGTAASTQILPAGAVAALGSGGAIDFGPATTASLTITPGVLTIGAAGVCTSNVFGIAISGASLSLSIPGPTPQTSIVVQSSSLFTVPLPSPTPIGPLVSQTGFDTLTVLMTETTQRAAFSSSDAATLYSLELLSGVTDLDGAPVRFDLSRGEVEVDFATTPAQVALLMTGRPSSVLLLTAGIGLSIPQPAEGPGTLALAMLFDGSAWNLGKATLELPGLFLPLDDGIAEPASELGADFSLVQSGRNWMVLGAIPDGAPRVHIEDFRLHIMRPQDLLSVEVSGSNMALEVVEGAAPTLGPANNGETTFWRVVFPPQHIAEQAFHKGSEQPGLDSGDDVMGPPPVQAVAAGPTQLAFIVPADLPRFPVTLASLLDWKLYEQAGTALDNPGQPPALQRPDLSRQTAIEIPYRVLLSVDSSSGWSHATTAPSDLSELWNTRLAFRKPLGAGQFVIDERPSSGARQGRAFYSPDLDAPTNAFGTSLDASQRAQIAHLTCDPAPYAHSFDVKQLMLSSLGATVHIDTGWNPPPNSAFDLTLWQHTASFGRDQYVRVGQRGFLAPYGHRATKVTVSERRFIAQPDGAQATAYLVQFEYIIITQPVRSYAGLDLPFSEVEFVTRITPTLSSPQPFPGANAFWITASNAPLQFDLAATDLFGRPLRFRAPGIFVGDDANFDASMTLAVQHFRSDSGINAPLDLGRQKIAFAPAADLEATSFEVASLTLDIADLRAGGGGSWKDPQTGEPLFRPSMTEASIHHAAAVALAGAPDTVAVTYFPGYVAQAGLHAADSATGVDVFLLLSNPPTGKLGADKAGVASPAYQLKSISKAFGAVGGDPQNILAKKIVPSDFLDQSARFLGDIKLVELIDTNGISQIPNLNTVINKAPDGTPTSAVTTFEWHPPLGMPLHEGDLSLVFLNTTLDLTVKITTQLTTPPQPPMSELHGKVGAFDLSFADLIALHFDSMRFDSVTGQKPTIDVQLKKILPVEFLGDLAFINALRDLIPSNGFSPSNASPNAALVAGDPPANGPFIDVTPTAIIAGFALAVPTVGFGVFSLENIRLSAALRLPLEDSPVSFQFNFGERDHKFLLTVDLLAGGGFLAIEVNSQGIQRLEFAIEFGANVALNLFIATGSAHILAGAHLIFGAGQPSSLTAYLRAGGELTVLGLISISVDFYLGMTRRDSGDLYGIASLSVEVSVAFISKSVTVTMERSFAGSDSGAAQSRLGSAGAATPVGAPPLADIISEADWSAYAAAFA